MSLVITADNPAPVGAEVSMVQTADGLQLRVALWRPASPPNAASQSPGTVVICGGRGEFIEKYFEVAGELIDRGFSVVAFDWRGQGGSARELANSRKGHIDDFLLYERDIAAIALKVLEPHCRRPWFWLGHSMGGAILLNCVRSGSALFERMVLTAPMIEIYGLRHPRLTRWLVDALDVLGFGAAFIPGGGETSVATKPFDGNVLTSDWQRYERSANVIAAAPDLGLGDPTIGWLNSAFRLIDRLADPEFPRRTLTPTLVIACGDDAVVDTRAAERFSTRLKAGRIVVIAHSKHEILMERDVFRQQFWAAFDAFIPGTRDLRAAPEVQPALSLGAA